MVDIAVVMGKANGLDRTFQMNKVISTRINSTTYRMINLRCYVNYLPEDIYVVGVAYFFVFISL